MASTKRSGDRKQHKHMQAEKVTCLVEWNLKVYNHAGNMIMAIARLCLYRVGDIWEWVPEHEALEWPKRWKLFMYSLRVCKWNWF